MVRRKMFFVTLFCFIAIYSNSQTNNVEPPDLMPKSPEIKAFDRYGEYPVSEYTGIPSINIPLYTIKLKDIEIPISLDYHATGIQVAQEATWVGLGWNLLAGGNVSTLSVETIDAPTSSFAQPSEWNKILNYKPMYYKEGDPRFFHEDGLRLWKFVCNAEDPLQSNTPDNTILEGLRGSGQRDIYKISVLGNTFKVSIHPVTGNIVYNGEKNKYKIIKNSWLSWTVTDENGYIYIFSDIESYLAPENVERTSTWYLTRIYYPGLSDILLEIKYSKSYPQYLPTFSEYINSYTTLDGLTSMDNFINRKFNSGQIKTCLSISSIISPLDSIIFTTQSRDDIRNGVALNQIVIYDRANKSEIKRFKFEYDYFTGTNTGASESTFDYVTKRLRLKKLYEQNGAQIKGSYMFAYNEIPLPYKTSFSQDLWGYYNGEDNSTPVKIQATATGDELQFATGRTLIPDPVFSSLNQTDKPLGFDDIRLANRGVDKNKIIAGMLKSITYPTGGRTEFEFEPNTISNYNYPVSNKIQASSIIVNKHVINNGNPGFSTPSQVFENEKEVKAKIKVFITGKDYNLSQMGSFYVTLTLARQQKKYMILTDEQKIEFNNKKSITIEEDIILPVGRITLNTFVLSGMPYQGYNLQNGVEATLVFQDLNYIENLKNTESVGGGLRIKKITNYTDNTTIASVKTYNYSLDGKLISPLHFAAIHSKRFPTSGTPSGTTGNTEQKTMGLLTSYNSYDYTSGGCDFVVGYDKVEVKTVSPINPANTGKVIYEFINIPSRSYYTNFFYPTEVQYCNGKVSEKTILNVKGDILRTEKNTYNINNLDYNYINIYASDNFIGPRDAYVPFDPAGFCQVVNPYAYNTSFDIIVYPTNSYNVYLTKKDETIYYDTQTLNIGSTYEYDLFNYHLKKSTVTSKERKKVTEYKYVLNYEPSDFPYQTSMVDLNMVGIPIEEIHTVNNTHVLSNKIEFSKFGSIIAPSSLLVKNGTGAYERRLKYENYDNYGNLRYFTMDDDASKTVYIWGYNYQYLLAEIKNATYNQITSIIPVSTLEAISKRKMPTAADFTLINNLRNNPSLKDAHITTFKHKPLIGITEITNPNGVTEYYSYDIFNRLEEKYFEVNKVKRILQKYDYYYKK